MFKHNVWKTLQKSIILVMVILLAMEPVLVAASPQLHERRQKEIETFASRHITQVNTGEISFHIGSLDDLIALTPGLQIAAGAFIGGAVAAVVKVLFQNADVTFKGILNGLKLTNAFEVVVDLVKVVSAYITTTIHSLNDAIQVLQDILSGGLRLWDDFITLVKRVGATRLISWGVNDSTFLVGHILRLLGAGVSLSDEALTALKSVSDDLIAAGVDLSDEAAEGLGRATKMLSGYELQGFVQKIRIDNPDLLEDILTSIKKLDDDELLDLVGNLKDKVGLEKFGTLMTKYAKDPDNLDLAKYIFSVLGNPKVNADAVRIAMSQGTEAVEALSLWGRADFPGGPLIENGKPILENDDIAKELAERAGKDAKVLENAKKLVNSAPPNVEKFDDLPSNIQTWIKEMAENSVHTNGTHMVLGKWKGYADGYSQYARETNAIFYYTHPNMYDELAALGPEKQSNYAWFINQQAVQKRISDGLAFEYTLKGTPSIDIAKEKAALEAIWEGATDEQVKTILSVENMPNRMKELIELKKAGYQYSFDEVYNSYIIIQ